MLKDSPSISSRHLSTSFELKSLETDGAFSGYGSVFGNVDAYGDIVAKGAFVKSLAEWKGRKKSPPVLWQHDTKQPIGTYTKLEEDKTGLFCEGKLVLEATGGRDAYALLKAGVVDGLSIGYMPVEWNYNAETGIFTLTEVELWEISLVTFPANDLARIDEVKRALGSETLPDERLFEKFLRDVGLSKRQAKIVISDGYRSLTENRRDAGEEKAELEESLGRLVNVFRI